MKSMLEKRKNLINIVIATIATITINIDLSSQEEVFKSFNGNSVMHIILFVFYLFSLSKISETKNKRQSIYCMMLAVLLSCAEIIGYNIQEYGSMFPLPIILVKSGIKLIGYMITFYIFFKIVFFWVDKKKIENEEVTNKVWKSGKKLLFISWIIILIAWIPHLLQYFPGNVSKDSFEQICQTLGMAKVRDHHPVFHTFIIYIAMSIGWFINGTNQLGILIYSIGQMLFLSFTFAYVIYDLNKKGVHKLITTLTLLFYAIYPMNGNYSIVMWKDVPFAAMIAWFTMVMIDLITNHEKFLSSKKKTFILFLISILLCLFRHNGICVFVMSVPFMLFFCKNYRKRLSIISILCIILYVLIKGPIYSRLEIEPVAINEALSVPLQQLARVIKYEEENLTETEKENIYKFFRTDNIGELYNPEVADPVKKKFLQAEFEENTGEFITIWIKLLFKFPQQYIDSFLATTYGYWYPEYIRSFYAAGISQVAINLDAADESGRVHLSPKETAEIETKPIVQSDLLEKIYKITQKRNIPMLSMLFSIGFQFWLVLTGLIYSIYQKKYQYILIYMPVILTWITASAGPSTGVFRYVYGMTICIPIFIGMISIIHKQESEEKQ